MNSGGAFVEVAGDRRGHAFRREELDALLNSGSDGSAGCVGVSTAALDERLSVCPRESLSIVLAKVTIAAS